MAKFATYGVAFWLCRWLFVTLVGFVIIIIVVFL
jgi:hypothetical protein